MPWFEIEPQWAGAGKRRLSVHVQAETWMDALKEGTQKLRPGSSLKDIQVQFDTDGGISVLQPEDGVRMKITQREGPPKPKTANKEDPATIREAQALMARPVIAPGVKYVTYTAGRSALPRPALPDPKPEPRPSREAREVAPPAPAKKVSGSSLPSTSLARHKAVGAPPPAPPEFRLSADAMGRIKRASWSGWGKKAAEALLELALELVPSEAGSTYEVDPKTGELILVAAWGPRARRLMEDGLVLAPGEGLAGFSARQRVLVVVSNPERDARFRRDIAQRLAFPVGSALIAPIVATYGVIGCVQLLNRKGGPYSDGDSLKLSQLVRAAAGFLERDPR